MDNVKFRKSILENGRKSEENKKYIKENFGIGLFPTAVHFKKFQDNFVNTFASCLETAYSGKLSAELRKKIAKDNLIKLSFIEDMQSADLRIDYNFEVNEINKDLGKIEIVVSPDGDAFKFNITNNLSAEMFSAAGFEEIVKSYNGISFVFENFELLVDAINEFSKSLIYSYVNYLNRISNTASSTSVNVEGVEAFLKYLEEEVKREVFINAVINKYVDFMIDKESNILSVRMRTFDRKFYEIATWIYAPETEKFKLLNFVTNVKGVKLKGISVLNIENVLAFIQAFKDDIQNIYGKYVSESRYNVTGNKIDFELKLENFMHKQYINKITHEAKYLESLQYLPKGIEFDHRANSYMVLKGNYFPEGVIVYPKELDRKWDDEEEATSTPGGMPATPQDMGVVKPIVSSTEVDKDVITDEIPVSVDAGSVADIIPAADVDFDYQDDMMDSVSDAVAIGGKEIVYSTKNPEEVKGALKDIAEIGEAGAVNKFIDGYNQGSKDLMITTDYINDFAVVPEDKIYSADGYMLIYNAENNKLVLLKDVNNERFSLGITEKRRLKEETPETELEEPKEDKTSEDQEETVEEELTQNKEVFYMSKSAEEAQEFISLLNTQDKDVDGFTLLMDRINEIKEEEVENEGGESEEAEEDTAELSDNFIDDFEIDLENDIIVEKNGYIIIYNQPEDLEQLSFIVLKDLLWDEELSDEENIEKVKEESRKIVGKANKMVFIREHKTRVKARIEGRKIALKKKKINEAWKMRVQDNYSSLEELESYDSTYGILDRVNASAEKQGLPTYDSIEDLWSANPIMTGSVNPEDLGIVKESKRPLRSKYRKEGYDDAYKKGGKIYYDESTGYVTMSMPGWDSPDLHPLAAYRVANKYFNSFDEFKKEFNIVKMPTLRVSGNDITDAFFILFGGRGGMSEFSDYIFNDMSEASYDNVMNGYDEDDMIEYIWNNIPELKSNDIESISNWMSNKDNYYDIIEAAESYFNFKFGVSLHDKEENESRLVKTMKEAIRRQDILIPAKPFEMISNEKFESVKKGLKGKIINNFVDKVTGNKYRVGIFEGNNNIVFSKVIKEKKLNESSDIEDFGYSVVEENGLYGLKNKEGDIKLPIKFKWIDNVMNINGFIRVQYQDGKYGMVEVFNYEESKKRRDEKLSGREYDKLKKLFTRILNHSISQEAMIAYGFDLSNPLKNNEEALAKRLSTKFGQQVTTEDIYEVLRELKLKTVADVVEKWLKLNKNESKKYEAMNQDVVDMFLNDSFPKDKRPVWGTTNLKISKTQDGWSLVNYATALLYRPDGSNDVYFNTKKYSQSTTVIQNKIKKVASDLGINLIEVDGDAEKLAK